MDAHEESYATTDLAIASMLVDQGYFLQSLERSDSKRVVFVFASSSSLKAAVQGFWNGSLLVEPRSYFEAIKLVKSRLYSEQRA